MLLKAFIPARILQERGMATSARPWQGSLLRDSIQWFSVVRNRLFHFQPFEMSVLQWDGDNMERAGYSMGIRYMMVWLAMSKSSEDELSKLLDTRKG